MKYVEPILFPIAPDPLMVMKFAGANNFKEIDVLPNVSPYYKHFDLYFNYVDPALLQRAVLDMFDNDTPQYEIGLDTFINYWIDRLKTIDSPYDEYYKLFVSKFIMIHPTYEKSCVSFKMWLEGIAESWNFVFKKCFTLNKLITLKRKYNTIIIPKTWTKEERNVIPWINLLHDLPPRYFSQEKTIKIASEYLFEGGRIYLLDPKDFFTVMYSIGDGYYATNTVFTKKTSPKPKTNTEKNINWL